MAIKKPDDPATGEHLYPNVRLNPKEMTVPGVAERCTMADLLRTTTVRWTDGGRPDGRPVPLLEPRYTDPGLEPRMERVYPTPWT